jgi:predicted TIM-barrel fold metal-dependent hydrolase
MRIIDACAQMGTGDRKGDILESGIPPSRILANMDEGKVTKSVVFPVTWSRYVKRANKEVRKAAEKYPDRFIAFARVNPSVEDAPSMLTEALDAGSSKGIRLRPFHDRFSLEDPGVERILEIARDRKLPVEVDGEKDRTALVRLVGQYRDVTFILAHLGSFDNWDWRNSRAYMDLLEEAPNFYVVPARSFSAATRPRFRRPWRSCESQ